MRIQQKTGNTYYYHSYRSDKDNKEAIEYINRKNSSLANALAKKNFYHKIVPLMDKQLKALETYELCENKINKIYDSLNDVRKQLIRSNSITVEEKLRMWETEQYEPYDKYKENKIFETDNGEMVRSKSEVIIANLLRKNSDHLLYKYERPLEIVVNGRREIIYPDFTVINIHTGKIKYWEHAGRMDDPKYADDFVQKLNKYNSNNYFIGEQLLYTFETKDTQLIIGNVNAIIQKLIET